MMREFPTTVLPLRLLAGRAGSMPADIPFTANGGNLHADSQAWLTGGTVNETPPAGAAAKSMSLLSQRGELDSARGSDGLSGDAHTFAFKMTK